MTNSKEKKDEDATTCTCSPSHYSSESEKASECSKRSNGQDDSNNRTVGPKFFIEDVASHQAVIGSIDVTEYKPASTEVENQVISDLPTIITHYTSSSREMNRDDCSNSTASTLDVDVTLNSPRCIFSNYWEGKQSNVVLPTVRSRSSSDCDNEASLTTRINIDESTQTGETLSLPDRSIKDLLPPNIPMFDDVKARVSQIQLESKSSILPRAAALNYERVANTDITRNGDSSLNQKQHNPLYPTQPTSSRRNIFNKKYNHENMHKVSSTSVIYHNRKMQQRSCLRRFGRSLSASPSPQTAGMGDEAGGRVTFDPNVSVVYETMQTKQAPSGWSKQFI